MRISLADITDKHKGKPAFIAAHGPSLTPYIPILPKLKEKGYVVIGINDWHLFHEKCPPPFVVSANSIYTVQRQWQTMNKHVETTVVFACLIDLTPLDFCEKHLKCDYLPYRSRGDPELSIQEELRKYTGFKRRYGGGATGALHQIALAILLGCRPIYVAGIDLDYRFGYADNGGKKPVTHDQIGSLHEYRAGILKDLTIIKDSADHAGIKIINLNKKSTFDTVPIGALPKEDING